MGSCSRLGLFSLGVTVNIRYKGMLFGSPTTEIHLGKAIKDYVNLKIATFYMGICKNSNQECN